MTASLRFNALRAVHGAVAEILDELGLGQKRLIDELAEIRGMKERRQAVVIGTLEGSVAAVEPGYGKFQRAPRIETRCAGIGMCQLLRLPRLGDQIRPFGIEEGEMAHYSSPRKARCWREAKRVFSRSKEA